MTLIQLEALRVLGSAANHIIHTSNGIEREDETGHLLIPERTRVTLWFFTYFAEQVASDAVTGWRVIDTSVA